LELLGTAAERGLFVDEAGLPAAVLDDLMAAGVFFLLEEVHTALKAGTAAGAIDFEARVT
jgi:hypothetical protein